MLAPPLQQNYILFFLDISVKISMNIYFKAGSVSGSLHLYYLYIFIHTPYSVTFFLEVIFIFLIVQ